MNPIEKHRIELNENGFTIFDDIFSPDEVERIISTIDQADTTNEAFRKSSEVFAIRQFLQEVPQVTNLVFNIKIEKLIHQLFGMDYFAVKSIYFDKPASSNWYVAYHQDLTISVDKKVELENYGPWTVKQNQFAVQPPTEILERIFTIRIHLDDTDENNGALRVIPKSHLKKVYRPQHIDWEKETETICKLRKGGIMIMKPLLLHSSSRSTNNKKRRVIHIEFSNQELPNGLKWGERLK